MEYSEKAVVAFSAKVFFSAPPNLFVFLAANLTTNIFFM